MTRSILARARMEIMAYFVLQACSDRTIEEYRVSLDNIEAFYVQTQVDHYSFHVMEMFREHVETRRSENDLGLTFYRCFLRTSHYVDNFYRGDLLTRLPDRRSEKQEEETIVLEDDGRTSKYIHLAEEFIENVGYGPKRKSDAKRILNRYLLFLEDDGWSPLYVVTIDRLARFMVYNKADSEQLRKQMTYIRAFMVYLEEHGMAENIPAHFTFIKHKASKPVLPCFSNDDIEKILNSIDTDTPAGCRAFAILMVALFTGLRSCDICGLCISDIDFEKQSLRVKQRKTKAIHELPLDSLVMTSIMDYINNHRPDSPYDNVFLTDSGVPYKTMNSILSGILDSAGLERGMMAGHSFHAFRRCLALWLIESGATPEMVSMILGHTDSKSFRRYIPLSDKTLEICCLGLDEIPCRQEVFL